MCFRYVSEGRAIERLLNTSQIDVQDAQSITNDFIMPYLNKLNLSAVLVGLGADGAAVMCGDKGGVYAY